MATVASEFLKALQEDIITAIHEQRYKNGAFIKLIPKETPILKAIVLLMASKHTTVEEKDILRRFADVYAKAVRELSGTEGDTGLLVPLLEPVTEVLGIFDKDFEVRSNVEGEGSGNNGSTSANAA